jgi:hypothetical protein
MKEHRLPERLVHHADNLEFMVQGIIYTGYELSREILSRFKANLSEERAEGLRLHLLFMINRNTFGQPYTDFGDWPALGDDMLELKEELESILRSKNVSASEGELQAILRYFEPASPEK